MRLGIITKDTKSEEIRKGKAANETKAEKNGACLIPQAGREIKGCEKVT